MNGVPAVTNQSDKTSVPGAPTGPASPGAPPPAPAGSAITGYKIEPLVLPAATGGDGTLVHALSPALPAGVELEEASRTVSGTPDAALPATVYSWTATDENGDTATLSFTIRVDLPVPAPAGGRLAAAAVTAPSWRC